MKKIALCVLLFGAAVLYGQRNFAPAPASISSTMVRLQGGTFTMGSPLSETDREDNEAQHRVTVSGFLIGKTEVTVGEFRRFVSATGYKTTSETSGGGYVYTGRDWLKKADVNWKDPGFSQTDNHPVTEVSWYDAIEYCNWLSRQENLTPAYTRNGDTVTWNRSANGYRLPTEAEWEYACRAGTTTRYWSGTEEASLAGKANVADLTAKEKYKDWAIMNIRDGYAETAPVGSFTANAWGLYDMHGNVWEWCWDYWNGNYATADQTDPVGAVSGENRVLRGGSCASIGLSLRSACRGRSYPTMRSNVLGIRLARPAP